MPASPHRILVVDDDAEIREVVSEVLRDDGYEVASAGHGREALDLIERDGIPAAVILDLMMPVMNGWQFLQLVRTTPAYAGIPVLVVSAFPEEGHEGASGTLRKPFNVEDLLSWLKAHVPAR